MATDAEVASAIGSSSTSDRARANHTGTQLASTISDFNTAVVNAVDARVVVPILFNPQAFSSATFVAIGIRYPWVASRNTFYRSGELIVDVTISTAGRVAEIRLVNVQTGAVLVTGTVSATGVFAFPFTAAIPTTDCRIEMQMRLQSGTSGATLNACSVEFDTI